MGPPTPLLWPGDPLRARPESYLPDVADRAARDAAALDRAGPGRRIDTAGRTVADSVDRILAATGWPPS
jgi:hypothetical protein